MKACDSCPNRWAAESVESEKLTFSALAAAFRGSRIFRFLAPVFEKRAAEAGERAATIREKGCQWWQQYPTREGWVEGCMAALHRAFLEKYGQDILLASDTIQAERKELAEALAKISESVEALGAPETMQYLAALGFRATVAYAPKLRRRETPELEETERTALVGSIVGAEDEA